MQEWCDDTLSLTIEEKVCAHYSLAAVDEGGINDIWKAFPFFESMTMNLYIWFHSWEFHFICRSFNLDDYSVYCIHIHTVYVYIYIYTAFI